MVRFTLVLLPLSLLLTIFDNRFFPIFIGTFIFEAWIMWTRSIGGEWVPTPQKTVDRMLKIAKLKKNEIVYDLGSGDGKIVISAAKLGARAVGIEIDPLRIFMSRIKIALENVGDLAVVRRGDLFKANVKSADVVTLFLLPKTMEKLESKLRKELKKGARIVSYGFSFKKWKPVKTDRKNKIYLYNA